jgi:hypothetical protein
MSDRQELIARLTVFAAMHRGFAEQTSHGGLCLGPKDVESVARALEEAAEMLTLDSNVPR